MVVGSFPVVECHLAHFLSDVNFRMWFGCHYLTFVGSGQASPTGHIRTGKFRFFVYIRHYGNTITCEPLFTDVTTPCKSISLLHCIIHYSHKLVDRQVVGEAIAPVVLNLDSKLRIERVMCVRSQRYIVVRIQSQ